MNQGQYIELLGNRYHYYQYGNGEKLMIAFHGFYQDATYFEKIYTNISQNYTVIALDLPHHGKSEFIETYFEVKHIAQIIEHFQQEFNVDKCTLFGYSLGGRVLLKYLEANPEATDLAILCAADGFYIDRWYALSTKNFIGKYFFKRFTQRPQSLIGLIEKMGKYKLISQRLLRFAKNNINDQKAFEQVANVWPMMSKLMPNLNKLKDNFIQYNIPALLFVGKYDVVVRPKPALKFADEIPNMEVYELDSGHSFANESLIQQITQLINQHLF